MKNVDYSWGKDFARIKQSIRDWDYRNLSLFSKTNLNNIWMARDIIEITTCMQDTTVIRFDMRSTNKTKVMFNQKLVSKSHVLLLKIDGSPFKYKTANNCLKVREQAEMLEWNKHGPFASPALL